VRQGANLFDRANLALWQLTHLLTLAVSEFADSPSAVE
jgi:hypothetical protein